MDPFRYEPLNLEVPAFRLVQILRGTADDDMQCELVQAWFNIPESQISYEALSYTWGSPIKSEEIILDGHSFFVTKNLFAALAHLRFEDQDRFMWIDAICINQDDAKERGHQVQQMADVYRNADQVVIWLGNALWQIDILMNALRLVQLEGLKFASRDWELTDPRWSDIWSNAMHTLGKSDAVARDGLKILLGRSWWKRVWILQEVANAKAATIFCGSHSVSARNFALLAPLLKEEPNAQCQAVLDLFPGPSRKHSWWNRERNLRILLHKFRESEASDPRDKIYALFGLSSDVYNEDALVTDYSKTLDEVIVDTFSFLLRFHKTQNKLQIIPNGFNPSGFLENLASLNTIILRHAIEGGHENEAKRVLAEGNVNITQIDEEGRTPLYLAALLGQQEIMELLLVQKAIEANPRDFHGRTLLSRLAELGNALIIKMLLTHSDVYVYFHDLDGKTPLWYAIEEGHPHVINLLIDQGGLRADYTNTHFPSPSQISTTFFHAVERSCITVVNALIESVGLNYKDEKGHTLLSHAAAQGNLLLLRLLLDRKEIDLNVKAHNGRTPLGIGVLNERDKVVELLLQQEGIGVNDRDHSGCTALHYATEKKNDVIFELLLQQKGIDVNTRDQFGYTVLHLAADNGYRIAIVLLLGKQTIDINVPDQFGHTPLFQAAMISDTFGLQILLKRTDIMADWKDNYGRTVLSCVAGKGINDALSVLLMRQDVDASSTCKSGRTPLSYAAEGSFVAMVKLLLQKETVCADSKDDQGLAPLSWAVIGMATEVVRILVNRRDVDVFSWSKWGETPYDIAKRAAFKTAGLERENRYKILFMLKLAEDDSSGGRI